MEPIRLNTVKIPFKVFRCALGAFFFMAGIISCRTAPHAPAKPAIRQQQPKTVDFKAQQRYYDRGLQHYSKENYKEARTAFQQVIQLGPNTPLGLKSQENLKKIQVILKTVEEIESK